MVRVLFFSVLRDLTGSDQVELPVDESGTTVGEFVSSVYETYPGVREWDSKLLIAVNGEFADREDSVKAGDEIALMPPVQGG